MRERENLITTTGGAGGVLDQSEGQNCNIYLQFYHCQREPGLSFINWLVGSIDKQGESET